jgi:polyhydroxybutyrate depolymerase
MWCADRSGRFTGGGQAVTGGSCMNSRSNSSTRRLVAVLAAAWLLALAGCASDEDASDGADVEVDDSQDDSGTTDDPGTTDGSEPPPTTGAPVPVPSAGCGSTDVAPAVETERTLSVAGAERRYLVTVPGAHDGENPVPVVFDFHGLMEGAEIHAGMSQYSALAEEEGFVVVFPHGTGEPLRWNANPDASPNHDLTYFDAVLAEVSDTLCVDTARVYATGLSNGAMFTSALLCERSDVLAAAAPVAGITDFASCDPARPVPIVSFHGTDDPILLFNGGVDLSAIPGSEASEGPTTTRPVADFDGEGYPANIAAFAERNGCDPEPNDTEVTAEVVHRVYDCPPGADVEFYIVVGGGHSWPSSEFSESIGEIVGHTTFDIDGTRDAWAFMEQFAQP